MTILTIYFTGDFTYEEAELDKIRNSLKVDLVLCFDNVEMLPDVQYPYIKVEKFDV